MKITCPACKTEITALPDVSVIACPLCDTLVDIIKEAKTDVPFIPDDQPQEAREEIFHTESNGDFSFLGVIRQSAEGTFYRTLRKGSNKQYGLLIFSEECTALPDFGERFKSEALQLRRLEHPGLLKILGGGAENGKYYLITEYFHWPHLKSFVNESSPPLYKIIELLIKSCETIGYVHSKGLIHGTLNPFNILVLGDSVKIADAGMAKLALKRIGLSTLSGVTRNWEIFNYFAPEQRSRGYMIDHRADIYSLSACFYEALTGEIPAGLFEKPSKLKEELDPKFDNIFMRALQRDPEERYRFIDNFRKDLEEIQAKQKAPAARKLKKEKTGWNRFSSFAAAVLVIVALALAFQYLPSLLKRSKSEATERKDNTAADRLVGENPTTREQKNDPFHSLWVNRPVVNMREKPNVTSPIIDKLQYGTLLKATDKTKPTGEQYEWYEVKSPLGKTGWIREDLLSEDKVTGGSRR